MKIFKTRSSEIVTQCQNYFSFWHHISTLVKKRNATFLYQLVNCRMNCASCSVTLRSKKLTHFLILSYILPSLIKFRPSPKLAITISDSFVVSVLTLIPTQLAPMPPPSFTPNSITVILSTTTYLSLRSPASNRSRTLLPVLLLKLLNAVTSLLSYTVFIGSK